MAARRLQRYPVGQRCRRGRQKLFAPERDATTFEGVDQRERSKHTPFPGEELEGIAFDSSRDRSPRVLCHGTNACWRRAKSAR